MKAPYATARGARYIANVPNMSDSPLIVVPVRTGTGVVSLRCGRLPAGERVGLAFTTEARLAEAMGADQPWIRIDERAMRAMLAPLGVNRIQVDPGIVVGNAMITAIRAV